MVSCRQLPFSSFNGRNLLLSLSIKPSRIPHTHNKRRKLEFKGNPRLIAASVESLPGDDDPLGSSHPTVTRSSIHLLTMQDSFKFLDALYRFSRPHTMLGTLVSVVSVSLLAILSAPAASTATFQTFMITRALLQAVSSALLMNICIVGINQIYDIEIDKINKPYLPLAAGDFKVQTATTIVWITGLVSLCIGIAANSPPLLATLSGSLLLGIAYSTELPFLRWKRYPAAAAACILAVRAVLVQLGFFCHMQLALGQSNIIITRPILFATAFMLLFSIVIALFKDLPDVAGDAKAGLQTLSVRFGPQRIFWMCIGLLELAYLGAIGVSLCSDATWRRVAGAAAHLLVGGLIWWRASRTDTLDPKSIYACYMDVWKAFYAEYLLLPLLA